MDAVKGVVLWLSTSDAMPALLDHPDKKSLSAKPVQVVSQVKSALIINFLILRAKTCKNTGHC